MGRRLPNGIVACPPWSLQPSPYRRDASGSNDKRATLAPFTPCALQPYGDHGTDEGTWIPRCTRKYQCAEPCIQTRLSCPLNTRNNTKGLWTEIPISAIMTMRMLRRSHSKKSDRGEMSV